MSEITVQAIICDTPKCRSNSQSQVLNHAGLWKLESAGWILQTENGEYEKHFCPKCSAVLPLIRKGQKRENAPTYAAELDAEPPPVTEPTAAVQPQATAERK